MPSLTQALGASTTQVLWIIDIYPLLMAGLLMPMGPLADYIGNRHLLLSGSIFGVASLLAAYAPTPVMLTGARGLLALGGAMIMPCVLGTIRRTFEDQDERAMALGSGTRIRKSPSQSMIEMGRIDGGGGARRNQVQSTPRKPNTPFTISKLEPSIVQSIPITYYHCACLVAYCVAYSILKEVP